MTRETDVNIHGEVKPVLNVERLFSYCFDKKTNFPGSDKATLFAAIVANNRAKVTDILEAGYPLNKSLTRCGSTEVVTPLHAAIVYGREDIVEILLSFGADVHLSREDGFTPAQLVWQFGTVGMLHRIMRYGASIACIDRLPAQILAKVKPGAHGRQTDFLLQAIRESDEAVVQKMMSDRAPAASGEPKLLEFPDCLGRTPLAYATMLGRMKMCRWLLTTHTAKRYFTQGEGINPIEWAILRGHTDVLQLLLEQGAEACGLVGNPEYATRLLYSAVLSDSFVAVHNILRICKVDDFPSHLLWPVVREAISYCSSVDIFRVLFTTIGESRILQCATASKASPHLTILVHAVQCARTAIVEMLLKKGAIADESLPNGTTPLHEALKISNPTIVRLLLSHGAAIAKDDDKVAAFIKRATTPSLRPTSNERKCAKLLLTRTKLKLLKT